MSKAMALLAGVKDNGACIGSELDVDNIHRILYSLKYSVTPLKTRQATSSNILYNLKSAAEVLQSGDIFVFYFSGHGGQQPDYNGDESYDDHDETLCAYDRNILDDELNEIWVSMRSDVRIFMISDSCNSGTNYRGAGNFTRPTPMTPFRSADRDIRSQMKAQMIHYGACKDSKWAAGYASGGAFTIALCDVWASGAFEGNYKQFHSRICQDVPSGQEPVYNEYGPVSDAFKKQKPFTTTPTVPDDTDLPVDDDLPETKVLKARVMHDRLRIRTGPGLDYQIVGHLGFGDVVEIKSFGGQDIWVKLGQEQWSAFSCDGIQYMELENS